MSSTPAAMCRLHWRWRVRQHAAGHAGQTSIPSLAVMAMPVELLLTLRDGLVPPDRRAADSRAAPGFCGWHTVSGTGATAVDADGGPPGRDRGMAWEGAPADSEAAKGLAFGYASARDARVVVYIILLWKFQLDAAALEAAGGCAQLKKVRSTQPPHHMHSTPCITQPQRGCRRNGSAPLSTAASSRCRC